MGYFRGARGLRQGDPMSPYLFVIIVDFLTQLPNHNISRADSFKYHWRCEKLVISHLCFVDDLLIFFHGNLNSGDVIKNCLVQLFNFIGLRANNNKSCLFVAVVSSFLWVSCL